MIKRTHDITSMSIDALLDLHGRIGATLSQKAEELRRQLHMLETGTATLGGDAEPKPSRLRKVPPKYRGPNGELWSGRGRLPRWLQACLDHGSRVEDFLIVRSADLGRSGINRGARRPEAA
jgi:DNA-binding protein H-NS